MKLVVLIVCSGIGYLMGLSLPGPLGAYARVLIPYHLFLLYMVKVDNETSGRSFPIGQTVITHIACVALLVGIAMGRRYVPFFGVIGLFIPGLAPFEAEWLFNGEARIESKEPAPAVQVVERESPDEYAEFMKYMSGPKREFRKLGIGPKDEYDLWRAARRDRFLNLLPEKDD
jgi:hypothetical protein